jgi:DnaJ-class molecular chaperone
MFKKVSEAYAVLSNLDRRKKYDLWGQTGQDDDDDIFEGMFGDIFSGMGMGGFGQADDFDSFMDFLEKDDIKSFKQMFRGLGKNYRMPGGKGKGSLRGRAVRNNKKGKKNDEDDMIDDMMAMMMMGDMMGMGGMGGPMPKMPKGMSMDDLEDMSDDEIERIMMGKKPKGKKASKSKKEQKSSK